MSKSLKQQIDAIINRAIAQGWTVTLTKSNHWRCIPPTDDGDVVFTGSTPSDHRSVKNFLAEMRRNGLDAEAPEQHDAPDLSAIPTNYDAKDGRAFRVCPFCNERIYIDAAAYGKDPYDPAILNAHADACESNPRNQ